MSQQQPITIYTRGWCGFCHRAKALLQHKGYAFTDIDIEAQPDQAAVMVERAGRTSVPQIFVGEHHVGGCDDLFALERAQKLDDLVVQG
ncbi:MAG: glutaredoxin 3 [Pontibacterium sp.]